MEVTKKSTDRWVDKEELLPVQMEYELVKKWNNAICSTMDGPRDYHIEWSKTEKEKYHMISLICGILEKKGGQMNLFTKQK